MHTNPLVKRGLLLLVLTVFQKGGKAFLTVASLEKASSLNIFICTAVCGSLSSQDGTHPVRNSLRIMDTSERLCHRFAKGDYSADRKLPA